MKTFGYKLPFPLMFELLVWVVYVGMYKYSYLLELTAENDPHSPYFPFPQLISYALLTSLYLIPLYRYMIPVMLDKKRYNLLFICTLFYLAFATKLNNYIVDFIYSGLNTDGYIARFFDERFALSARRMKSPFAGWDLNLVVTDLIAFGGVALARFAFDNEKRRHELERNNLVLQLDSLKTQLQPHFFFNTLNSIYSFSLRGSADTSKFILQLSDMMRYILYECNKDDVSLQQEIIFMQNYFELEQKKYPDARIRFSIEPVSAIAIPPLLFLPLIENSFKHGAHHMLDNAGVRASLKSNDTSIEFCIENDTFRMKGQKDNPGGIGLETIKRRLDLYYPGKHKLTINQTENRYKSELLIFL